MSRKLSRASSHASLGMGESISWPSRLMESDLAGRACKICTADKSAGVLSDAEALSCGGVSESAKAS